MLKKVITFLFISLSCIAHAQYKVKFILKEQTVVHHDSIYITGTMNNWDSTPNPKYQMQPEGVNEKIIVFNVNAGLLRYKFHRGSWLKVEKQYSGDEVPDHLLTVTKDTTVTDSVVSWRDEMLSDKKILVSQSIADTTRVFLLAAISTNYAFFPEVYNSDSALLYAQQALKLQQKISATAASKVYNPEKDTEMLMNLKEKIAGLLSSLGNYTKALELRFENIVLAEKTHNKLWLSESYYSVSNDYSAMKDYHSALNYGKSMDSVLAAIDTNNIRNRQDYWRWYRNNRWYADYTIANTFLKLQLPDSALHYAQQMSLKNQDTSRPAFKAIENILLGNIYTQKGKIDSAFLYFRTAIPGAITSFAYQLVADIHAGMAKLYQQEHNIDSALYYASQAFTYFQNNKLTVQAWGENSNNHLADIGPLLAELYSQNHQPDSAYKYLRFSVMLKDSLYNSDKIRQFQTLSFNEATRRNQLEQQEKESQQRYKTRMTIYGLLGGMAAFLALAFILYRNNKHKQTANTLLQHQKQEIETTLAELKNTQTQLVQSEKMASLGELTAGIAHEIQNPLNFVNNFSDINTELIDETAAEISKGNMEDAIAILNDIKDNEQKINHHGKRADAIVKGMLQHSRSSSGKKELTDINKLADEYLRLAYHGLRAKDKSFNAALKTDFDTTVGLINIIPQDIGRVILNLITNAFYAVAEKKKAGLESYEPTVSISTKKSGDKILLSVKDNGNGIPQKIIDKIFQPFFTTKPTGEGTGLGLSMAYDIVKAHGGEIKVQTEEDNGTLFQITLPV